VAEQPEQPAAQVPPLEQHEDHERQHEPGSSQRSDDGTETHFGRWRGSW
jgi:hypothetical protein